MRLSSTRIVAAILCLHLAGSAVLRAEWIVAETRPHAGAPAGLECTRFTLRQPATGRVVALDLVRFDIRRHDLCVIDRPAPAGGPDLAGALRARGCVAGVNGGYFTPEFRGLGLVISEGRTVEPLAASRLLTGVFAVTRDRALLLRREEYREGSATVHALQAGPFLVDAGRAVPGLNSERAAARTALATDGASGWALVSSRSPTLAELGEILAQPGLIPGFVVRRSLNLDGGSSSGLWIATSPEPVHIPELGPVRNYVGVLPRR